MKIKFEYEAYWNVRSFDEDLAIFDLNCSDLNVITTTALTVTPDCNPGQPYAWLAQVNCECEVELESMEMDEFYDEVNLITSKFFELTIAECSLVPLKGEDGEVYLKLNC